MWSESSSVSAVNLEKKFTTAPDISIFFLGGGYFLARPTDNVQHDDRTWLRARQCVAWSQHRKRTLWDQHQLSRTCRRVQKTPSTSSALVGRPTPRGIFATKNARTSRGQMHLHTVKHLSQSFQLLPIIITSVAIKSPRNLKFYTFRPTPIFNFCSGAGVVCQKNLQLDCHVCHDVRLSSIQWRASNR